MSKNFTKKTWYDKPSIATPILAEDLNRIEDALADQDTRIDTLENSSGGSGDGTSITVDSALSETSENPVQNKVINAELVSLKEDIANMPEADGSIYIGTEDSIPEGTTLWIDTSEESESEEEAETSNYVKSINGTLPDENGNVEIDTQSSGGGYKLLYQKIFTDDDEVAYIEIPVNVKNYTTIHWNVFIPERTREKSNVSRMKIANEGTAWYSGLIISFDSISSSNVAELKVSLSGDVFIANGVVYDYGSTIKKQYINASTGGNSAGMPVTLEDTTILCYEINDRSVGNIESGTVISVWGC